MEGFDTMAMPYLGTPPLSLGSMQGHDYLQAMSGIDMPDHQSSFEPEPYVRFVSGVVWLCFGMDSPPANADRTLIQ